MQKPKEAPFIPLRKKIPSPFKLTEKKEAAHFTLFPHPGEQNPLDSLSGRKIGEMETKDTALDQQEEKIKTKAYQEGFQSGIITGKEESEKEALKQLTPLIESLNNLITQTKHAQTAILKNHSCWHEASRFLQE